MPLPQYTIYKYVSNRADHPMMLDNECTIRLVLSAGTARLT